MQCAVCRATMRAPFDTFGFVESLYSALSLASPKVLGFHFLWSISHCGSFFRDPFSRGGHSGARADGFKAGPVILSQQTTIWGEANVRNLPENTLFFCPLVCLSSHKKQYQIYLCLPKNWPLQCVVYSLQNFSGHMYVFVCAFGCVCVYS